MVLKALTDRFTGSRVGKIVSQEADLCGSRARLPERLREDQVENFCKEYGGFIDVEDAFNRFDAYWDHEEARTEFSKMAKLKFPLLFRALFKAFRADLFKAFIAKLVWSIVVLGSIWFFVFQILGFIRSRGKEGYEPPVPNYEIYLCIGFTVAMFILNTGLQQMGMYSAILGGKVKAALTTAIYRKMIVRDAYESNADVVALVAKDVEKLEEACLSLQFLWSGIVETLAVLGIVGGLIGTAILPGVGLMAVFLPAQYLMGMMVAWRKKKLAMISNKRIGLMEEILRGIKLIKIYGWEDSFFMNVTAIRAEEAALLTRINFIKSSIVGLIFALPPLFSCVVFGTQEALSTVEPVLTFTVLSFFNTLRVPFAKLPKALRDVLDAFSCVERINEFLFEPDLHPELMENHWDDVEPEGIVFRNVSVSYGKHAKLVLSNINLNVPKGSLMMVAGPVASGKSNLLKSILGDLTVREGTSFTSHSRAYVPQIPWTALGTIRDNIVFGKPFDEAHYRKVLHACALEPDLKLFKDGDQTWIGERGGNLSGGQKQRIALARAAYSKADLYVLDSPLSAVDMYTCQHIFKYCIQDLMLASGGTVVLATHQTELFHYSDHLVVMDSGDIAYNAPYRYEGIRHLFPNFSGDGEEIGTIEKKPPKASKAAAAYDSQKPKGVSKKDVNAAAKKEELSEGIYKWYINKLGWGFWGATLFFICGQVMRVYSDNWVSVWTSRKYASAGYVSDAFYAGLFGLLVLVFLTMSFCRAYIYYHVGKKGANKVHDSAFAGTIKAPMHFFHVTPIGKLLAYYSKDTEVIDDMLVDNVLMYQIFLWILVLALGVVSYALPTFLAIVGPLMVIYVCICYTYIRASVPLKKNASESLQQVVAHTAETLSGIAVVRAFRMQDKFVADNLKFQARSSVCSFSISNLTLWLFFRVDIIGISLVLGCCLLAVLDTSLKPNVAGLIVSNSFQILLFFSMMTRFMGDFHDNMKSTDVARKLSDLEPEMEPIVEVEPPKQWPSKGEIKFDGVVMPYLPNTPPVLKGINFSMREGEKVGVVGRTGAGKSSLIVALYRLAEISEGKIQVDSIDCSMVNLNKLRRSMAIIPQEPVMFGGTIRTNLDPFNEHSDDEIYDVLRKCLLGPMIDSSEDGLHTQVEQLGTNFSLGTQQLICLARAMLNKSRVLLLDEATAALDSDTNAAVGRVLKEHFSDRTIFTIAHRLDTIIESDRILVMNAGVVAEYDPPDVLLDNPDSIFYELCMNTGAAQFQVLYNKAKANVPYRLPQV
jgi:ABC-type multidrug transport system fused ATPase/permease subunit